MFRTRVGRLRRAPLLVASVIVAASLLAACGDFAGGSAQDIVASAESEMKDLGALHYVGELEGTTPITLDLDVTSGGDCSGIISQGAGKLMILSRGGETWFRPDATYWKENAESAEKAEKIITAVGDRWVALGQDTGTDYRRFCNLDELLDQMFGDVDDATYRKDSTTRVGGREAVTITRATDNGTQVTGYVSVEEPHYLLQLRTTGGERTGTFTFSGFDERVDVEAPDAGDVATLDSLS